MDKHYTPALYGRLQTLATQRDWQGLSSYLGGLSNAHFRTAGYMLGERVMPTLMEADAWEMASELIRYNDKAFLVTMMKAIAEGLRSDRLHLRTSGCHTLLAQLKPNAINVQKTLVALLPVVERPEDVQWLMGKLEMEKAESRIALLIRIPTLPCSFMLFHTLRFVEHNRPLLIRTALFLIKRDDDLSFNLASLIKAYYDLEEVKGTFSLRLEPYKLARIENSYEAFCEAMRR